MSNEIVTMTEDELRDYKVPKFDSLDDLMKFIKDLTERKHDYGTCCYAMSLAATASFEYAAGQLHVTGFQAGCAGMDIIKRVKNIDGPFILLDGDKTLYPQYDLNDDLNNWMGSDHFRKWQKEEANKKLNESDHAHKAVSSHWQKLANQEIKEK